MSAWALAFLVVGAIAAMVAPVAIEKWREPVCLKLQPAAPTIACFRQCDTLDFPLRSDCMDVCKQASCAEWSAR